MASTIDWAMVSAWAAMVTAVGAIVAIWLQNRHATVTRSLDILFRLEAKFDGDRMKQLRRTAASGFLAGRFSDEAYYVLDFFEEAGLLLRLKAIHEEILFESFYHSIPAYWFTAKKYVVEMRRTNPELYDNLELVAERALRYSTRKTGQDAARSGDASSWKYFMEREAQAS